MFGRGRGSATAGNFEESDSDRTIAYDRPTKAQIKRATRTRFIWSLVTSLLLFISVIFIILVEVGNTSINSTLNRIYFIKLNLANIVPTRVPNALLINSIAQTIGLHDFYTVGLWNFCEANMGVGVVHCSSPKTLYWFDPVSIIQSELLAGATIALPADINGILGLIRMVSHWMFGLFLAGACLSFVMIFIVPLTVYTRWAGLPITIFTFLAALFTTVATVIATVMFIIMKNVVTSVTQLNISASIGVEMFAFMWVAAATSIIAFVIQLGSCCCCASRRDVRTGKKRGSSKAWQTPITEKPVDRPIEPSGPVEE